MALSPELLRRPARPEAPSSATARTAAEVLGDAFADYVFFASVLNPLQRRVGLPLMFLAVAEQFRRMPHGQIDLAERDGRTVGAAVWGDGTLADIGILEATTYGHARFAIAVGLRDALRVMRAQEAAMRIHHELIAEPHLYLVGLGVRPGWQGRGVGTELLRRGHARADELGLPCFLETNLPENAALYTREGYLTLRRQELGGLPTWFMLRPAR